MSQPICKFFLEFRCTKGSECKFSHTKSTTTDPGFSLVKSKFKKSRSKLIKVNTETFEPWYEPQHMQIQFLNPSKPQHVITESDVFILPGLFDDLIYSNQSVYSSLVEEIERSNCKNLDQLWKPWHGNTHLIADDHLRWKESCPIFNLIIDRIAKFFDMDVKATRFNLYEDLRDYKPMHFDAAAIDPKKALAQNLTVGISFGYSRSVEFEHAVTRSRVSFPLTNGTIYGFGKQVNIDWRHGIPPIKPEIINEIELTTPKEQTGRVSIILWGKSNQIKL
jgi:hypothetical protein